jgi:hypothetical protein
MVYQDRSQRSERFPSERQSQPITSFLSEDGGWWIQGSLDDGNTICVPDTLLKLEHLQQTFEIEAMEANSSLHGRTTTADESATVLQQDGIMQPDDWRQEDMTADGSLQQAAEACFVGQLFKSLVPVSYSLD